MVYAKENEDFLESCSGSDSEAEGQLESSTLVNMHWSSLGLLNMDARVERYCCKGCRRSFLSQNKLDIHSENCQESNLHRCKECGEILHNWDELKRHKYLFHSPDDHHACGRCLKRFRLTKKLVKHIKKYDFQCKPRKLSDLKHENPESMVPYESDKISSEIIKKTSGEGIESNCNMQEFNKTFKPDSETDVSSNTSYTCDICSYVCKCRVQLIVHIKESHRAGKPLICRVCHSGFTSKLSLGVHQHIHEKQFTCKGCGKGFLSKNYYSKHMKLCLKVITYKCHICNREYCTKEVLKKHVDRHLTVKRFACTQCPKTYLNHCSLDSHVSIAHLNLKLHECGICEKRFPSRLRLVCHLASHSDERPFKCYHCERFFKLKNALRKHEKRMHVRKEYDLC